MSAANRSAVKGLTPLIFVEDINRSLAFYTNRLGFELKQEWAPEGTLAWCLLARGTVGFMLQQAGEEDEPAAGRGRGVCFYFACDDADAMHAEFLANGLSLDPPTVAFYGMKQLMVKDPDGYELCFQNPTGTAA